METLPENEVRNTGRLGADAAAADITLRSADDDLDQPASDLRFAGENVETTGGPVPPLETEIRKTSPLKTDAAATDVILRSSDEDPDQMASDLNLAGQDAKTSGDPAPEHGMAETRRLKADVGAVNIILRSFDETPDQMASDLRLASDYARATGGPVPPLELVKQYRDSFRQTLQEAQNAKILSESPFLADWMLNPENAAVASDDVSNLSWLQGLVRGTLATRQRVAAHLETSYYQYRFEQTSGRAADRLKMFDELLEESRSTFIIEGNEYRSRDGSEYIGAAMRWLDARYADAWGTDDNASAAEFAARMQESRDKLKANPMSQIAQDFEAKAVVEGADLRETSVNIASAFLENPLGGLSWALETAGEQAPLLVAAPLATAVTRNPYVGLTVLGATTYANERYTSPGDFYEERGLDLHKPEDIQRLISSPDLIKQAANLGMIRGAVAAAFSVISGGLGERVLAKNPFVDWVAQRTQEILLGAAGEYSARRAAGQEVDWNEVMTAGFAQSIAMLPVEIGKVGSEFHSKRVKAKNAVARKQMFLEISGKVQHSALRKRWPEKFRELVKQATANGPAENLYVPADRFAQHFQTKGVDPYGFIDDLDGVTREDLDAALASGGDLKIPTATYAEKIAGSEDDAFLVDNMRFHPDDMTAQQAAEFKAKPLAASERRSAPSGELKSMPKPAVAGGRRSTPQGSPAPISKPPMSTNRRSAPSSERKTTPKPPAATEKRGAPKKPRNDPKAAGAKQSRREVKAVAKDTKGVRAKRKALRPANKL